MKGWIKLHRKDDCCEINIRASFIETVSLVADVGITRICMTGEDNSYLDVEESVEEVLSAIEETENKKSLYDKLKDVRHKCIFYNGGCELTKCPYADINEKFWCNLLDNMYCLDKIPEEYRG